MSNRVASAPMVYVDTCVYADLLGMNNALHVDTGEPRWRSAKALFDAVNGDRVILAASSMIEAEVACLGDYRSGSDADRETVRGWFNAASTQWTDVDRFLSRDVGPLSDEWNAYRADKRKKLGGADAVHLAGAIRLGCDYLMTHDGGFPIGHNVRGVKVIRPAIVWERDLIDELTEIDDEASVLSDGHQS